MTEARTQGIKKPKAFNSISSNKYYILIVLTVVYSLNFLDRVVFNFLIDPMKREFDLSDRTMGLIAGFGFVLLYTAIGVPIARLADRSNRRNIISIGMAMWSVMTICCGLAQNTVSLVLARMGVGVGEAAGSPASQSMLADLFDKEERARALGIFAAGTYCGVFMGFFFGGYVNAVYGWRTAFIVAGLPGILFALIMYLTVKEPQRGQYGIRAEVEPFKPSIAFLISQRSLVLMGVGSCLSSYSNYAVSVWIASFLGRVHHLTSQEIGFYAATFTGLSGMAGAIIGGIIATYFGRMDDRYRLWVPAFGSLLAGVSLTLCVLTEAFPLMVISLGIVSFLGAFTIGPVFALAQTLAKPGMRATSSALVLMASGCIGQGLGPVGVGWLSDMLQPQFAHQAIRYALLSPAIIYALAGLLYFRGGDFLKSDIARAEA